jgi:DNA-binding transcriptional regulator YhcF (GntR family)
MEWEFDNSIPIYLQLVEMLKLQIISGKIKSGDKLNSVRDLAREAGVNPNTMQRALAELERENLIYSVRTSGRFVKEDTETIKTMKSKIASEKIDALFETLYDLGYTKEEINAVILNKINTNREGE